MIPSRRGDRFGGRPIERSIFVRVGAGIAPRAAAACLAFGFAGCSPDASPSARSGVGLSPPTGWNRVEPDAWPVPGTPLAAWRGPAGASLVAYRTLLVPGASAQGQADELAHRMTNLPGVRVLDRRVASVGGFAAARVELVGPGDGSTLAPSGTGVPMRAGTPLVPTRRLVMIVPRGGDTIQFVWHARDDAFKTIGPAIEATLAGAAIRPTSPTY